MGRNRLLSMLLLGAVAACEIPAASFHPLYEDDDLVAVPALEGEWHDDEDLTYTFVETGRGEFELTMAGTEGEAWHALAHTFELDGRLFLDVTSDLDVWDGAEGPIPLAMAPVHMWFPLEVDGDVLMLDYIEHDTWLEVLPRHNETVLTFADASETEYVILPQETEALQRIVSRVFSSDDIERDPLVLMRSTQDSR